MAQYSDSTTKKKAKPAAAPKPAPATDTYQTAPPAPAGYTASKPAPPYGYGQTEPPSALVAEDPGDSCSLTVAVIDKVSKAPLAKAHVTLRGEDFQQTLPTDSQGQASWVSLESGEYGVEVAHYHGYQRGPKQEPVTLTQDEDAVLHIGLEPEQASLLVRALYDAKRCGDPADQVPIQSLSFGVYNGSQLLGSGKTGDDGTACISFHYTGWAEVRPHGQVRYSGVPLTPGTSERLLVLMEAGQQSEADLVYVSETASLAVEALLTADDGHGEAVPLHGVVVALYKPGTTVPTRQAVTAGRALLFDDLAAGTYVIQISCRSNFRHVDGRGAEGRK